MIYYYRIEHPKEGFALQDWPHRIKSRETSRCVEAQDGDAVLVHSGFHPVVAGPGYNYVYCQDFLAGTSRTLSVTEDPTAWINQRGKSRPAPSIWYAVATLSFRAVMK